MAGNMWEWTTEVGNYGDEQVLLTEEQEDMASYAVLRGGSLRDYGSGIPVSRRNGDNFTSNTRGADIGFRVALYIK